MKVKTIQFTTKVSCPAGHSWAPHGTPGISGSLDSAVLAEHFTTAISTSFDLDDFGTCPACDGVASTVTFEAVPGEIDTPDAATPPST